MLAIFLKKRVFLAIRRLLPATIPATAADAALLFCISSFVNIIDGESEFTVLEWFLCTMLLAVLRFCFLRFRGSVAESTFRTSGALLQMRFFRTLKNLHPKFFHRESADAELRAAFEATEMLPKSGESLVQALQAIVQLFVFIPVLLYLSWQLSLVLFFAVLPVVSFTQKKLHQMARAEAENMQNEGALRADLERARDMKRFWSSNEEKSVMSSRVLLAVKNLFAVGRSLAVRKLTLAYAVEAISVIAMVIVLALCAWMIAQGWMQPRDLVLYSSAVFLCYKPVKECSRAMPQLRSAATAFKLLQEFENMAFSPQHCKKEDWSHICLQKAAFAYGNVQVFKNFDFTATFENGKHVFLLGPNGAGKSTLLRLLAGLEILDEGALQKSTDDDVFFLSQGVFLPPVSILRDEILPQFKAQATEEQIAKVEHFARISNAVSLLEKEKHSGGESARVGLLWALASKAKLVLLDEPLAYISRFDKDEIFEAFLNAADALQKNIILSGHEELPNNLAEKFTFATIEKTMQNKG